MNKRKIIAVDFDGTIVEDNFPHIGKIKQEVLNKIKKWKAEGHTIIIWTCRTGEFLDKAKKFLDKHNIPYDAINENCNNPFGDKQNPRKVYAHIYLDDKALNVADLEGFNIDTLNWDNQSEIEEDIKTLKSMLYRVYKINPDLVDIEKVEQITKKYNIE